MKPFRAAEISRLGATTRPPRATLRLSRAERLRRWADVLDEAPGGLRAFPGVEHVAVRDLRRMRVPGSPLSVAASDPRLRAAGLCDDTFGEACRFFELTRWQLHALLCECAHGATVPADWITWVLRFYAEPPGPWAQTDPRGFVKCLLAAAVVAIPLYVL